MDHTMLARQPPDPAARSTGSSWRRWFAGVVVAAALIGAVLHFGELEAFSRLLVSARPGWLMAAAVLQVSTYVSLSIGWSAVLRRAGSPQPLHRLLRIAIVKLFADQAIPSAGVGGNVVLVDRLVEAGVPRPHAVAALIVSMIGFYAAYGLCAIAMLVLLWLHGMASPLIVGVVTAFLLVAMAIPSLALWLRHRGSQPLPPRIEKIGWIERLLTAVGQAPAELLNDHCLILRVAGCNALVFVADAGTLFFCMRALGQPPQIASAFIAFIMASVVVTLGPIPLGLGSFEAASTAMLQSLGVPVEAAFAGTMLFRVMALWLPLLPGLILFRSHLR